MDFEDRQDVCSLLSFFFEGKRSRRVYIKGGSGPYMECQLVIFYSSDVKYIGRVKKKRRVR